MKEPYIVYYSINTKLGNTVVEGNSSTEVTTIVEERFRKRGYKKYEIDGVLTVAEEQNMMKNREQMWGAHYFE